MKLFFPALIQSIDGALCNDKIIIHAFTTHWTQLRCSPLEVHVGAAVTAEVVHFCILVFCPRIIYSNNATIIQLTRSHVRDINCIFFVFVSILVISNNAA